MSQPAPELHLALPGLLWPAQAIRDLVFDLQLPALSWLLGKGSRRVVPVADSRQWLAEIAGLSSSQLPVAALRVNACALQQTGRWLCLDPVHLRVERTQLIVQDPAALQLTHAEAEALQRDLSPLLEELGELHIGTPHEWHLHLHEGGAIRCAPLPDAIGLSAEQMMPETSNDKARLWRRLLTEVQVALHTHPVNLARSERGQPAVNSLWPWGEGTLDDVHRAESNRDAPNRGTQNWTHIQADGAVWQGLARHLACSWSPQPERFSAVEGKTLVVLPDLESAARSRDAMHWLRTVQVLERDWFAPLQLALQQGRLKTLVLHGQGAGHAMRVTVGAGDRLRFWRKPAPLSVLGVQSANSADAPDAATGRA